MGSKKKISGSVPGEKAPAFQAGGPGSKRTPTPTAKSTHQLWRERNREHLLQYEKERYQRRKIAKAEYIRRWREAHPEAKKKENQIRKERMGGVLTNFGRAERDLLFKKQLGLCGLCGGLLAQYEIDHIVPLCKGGIHHIENAHLVHPYCNRVKGQKLPSQIGLITSVTVMPSERVPQAIPVSITATTEG